MWKGTSQSLRSLQTLPGGIRPVKHATRLLSRKHHAPEPEKLHLSRLSQRAAVKVFLWQYGKRLWKRPKKNGAKLLPWWKTLHVFLGLTNVVSAKGLPFHIVDDDCYVFLDWSHETERLDWMDRVIRMDTTLWVFYGKCLPSGAAFFSPEKYAAFPPGTPVVNRSSACSHERWKIAHLHLEQLRLCESSTDYIHLRKGNVRNKYIITTVRPTVNSSSRNAFIPTEASRSIFLTYSWMTRGRSSVIWASENLLERVLRELFRSFQLTHARDQIKSVQFINNE